MGDGDGIITRTELSGVISSFRVDLKDDEIERLLSVHDGNSSGALERSEFDGLMRGFRQDDTSLDAEMERVFLRFDQNRDGGLDAREVRVLMEASGQVMTLRDAKLIVFEADEDGNGRIDAEEFKGVSP